MSITLAKGAVYIDVNSASIIAALGYTPNIAGAVTITSGMTLNATHWSKALVFNSATPITITLPQQSTLTTAVGTTNIPYYENIGAGTVTFATQGSETFATGSNTTADTGSRGAILRDSSTTWSLSGGTIVLTSSMQFVLATGANNTYPIGFTPGAGTITAISSVCTSGTITANVTISNNAITVTASSVSSTPSTQVPTAANTFAAGEIIRVVLTANSSAVGANINVQYTYRQNI